MDDKGAPRQGLGRLPPKLLLAGIVGQLGTSNGVSRYLSLKPSSTDKAISTNENRTTGQSERHPGRFSAPPPPPNSNESEQSNTGQCIEFTEAARV